MDIPETSLSFTPGRLGPELGSVLTVIGSTLAERCMCVDIDVDIRTGSQGTELVGHQNIIAVYGNDSPTGGDHFVVAALKGGADTTCSAAYVSPSGEASESFLESDSRDGVQLVTRGLIGDMSESDVLDSEVLETAGIRTIAVLAGRVCEQAVDCDPGSSSSDEAVCGRMIGRLLVAAGNATADLAPDRTARARVKLKWRGSGVALEGHEVLIDAGQKQGEAWAGFTLQCTPDWRIDSCTASFFDPYEGQNSRESIVVEGGRFLYTQVVKSEDPTSRSVDATTAVDLIAGMAERVQRCATGEN